MKYRVLYLEDQEADSMVADFKERDVELIVNKANSFIEAITSLRRPGIDAYLMDYRLSQGKSYLDAPAFAAFLRTEKKRGVGVQAPIFMITSETGLRILRDREDRQDLFDMVLRKDKYRECKDWMINSFISHIEAYRLIADKNYSLETALDLNNKEIKDYIDSRLLKGLNQFKNDRNIYAFLKAIKLYLLGSPCVLISEDDLAARFGIDVVKSGDSWEQFKNCISSCKYCGVLSDVRVRWWQPRITDVWDKISPGRSLRMTEANQRVDILNKYYSIELEPAKPIEECESTCFWTVCKALKRPLDPAEGFVCNDRYKRPWEENEYISLIGALEYPEYQKFLSESDKREIRAYGKTQ